MNEFFKKVAARVASLWAGWSMIQRVILSIIVVAVIGGIAALFRISSTPVMVSLITRPITDEDVLDRITFRLDQEGVKFNVTANGIVQVSEEATARKMRAILIREDLIPKEADPWQIFDKERWTITDMERNINFQRSQTRMIINHIKAIDDIDDVKLNIVWPKDTLFRTDQNPVSASMTIIPKPGSDITENRKKIEGIQKLLKFAIEGLQDEHITIVDNKGLQLNDFDGMAAIDRLSLIEREKKFILKLEKEYRDLVLASLQGTFSPDRVRDLNIKIDMDMSKKTVAETEILPTILKAPTPGLPYDDSIRRESILISESTSQITWEGTGFNPEGPAGVEGQTPPAFKDMNNLYGKMTQTLRTHNEEIGKREIQEERSPQIDRITVSVNIDGKWNWKFDEKKNPVIKSDGTIEREYTPVPLEDMRKADALVKGAVGYNTSRGDSVTVQNIPFDRTLEFKVEDDAYFKKKQTRMTVIVFLSGLTLLLFGFIMFRMISREMERRRRLAEEERARR